MSEVKYAIVVTRQFYGRRTVKGRLIENESCQEWTGTRAEALEKIEELNNARYYTSYNESGRASYSIVRVKGDA